MPLPAATALTKVNYLGQASFHVFIANDLSETERACPLPEYSSLGATGAKAPALPADLVADVTKQWRWKYSYIRATFDGATSKLGNGDIAFLPAGNAVTLVQGAWIDIDTSYAPVVNAGALTLNKVHPDIDIINSGTTLVLKTGSK